MNKLEATFDTIYSIDLTYGHMCWELCGDAHCCQFARYQMGNVRQDIMLLPHEYAYMAKRGYLEQYDRFDHFFEEYQMESATIRFEQISIASAPGECSCSHDMRPTTCRLYPLLPVYRLGVGLTGVQPYYALEDELEIAAGVPTTCRIARISPSELSQFLRIANAIAAEPNCLFHVMAYERVRSHVRDALSKRQQDPKRRIESSPQGITGAMRTLGMELVSGSLFSVSDLKAELEELAQRFIKLYGPGFQDAVLDA